MEEEEGESSWQLGVAPKATEEGDCLDGIYSWVGVGEGTTREFTTAVNWVSWRHTEG